LYTIPGYSGGGSRPGSATDHTTDQKTPYCDELGYVATNSIKMLAVTQRRDKEYNTGLGRQIYLNYLIYNIDMYIFFISGGVRWTIWYIKMLII